MSKIYKNTYFPHDNNAREDRKIKDMLAYFRKESELKAQASVCIYWWIIEDMHSDDYPVNKIDAFADNYRCSVDFLQTILTKFDLFHEENGFYVSARVVKNQKEQEEKRKRRQKAAYFRWKNATDKTDAADATEEIIKIYSEEFKKSPVVSVELKEEIAKVTAENSISLDTWKKVFHNAQRGWNIEGKNKKPDLRTIIKKWDSFANDDYFLAPDTTASEQLKLQEQKKRQEEEERRAEYKRAEAAVCDKESAIKFLNKYFAMPQSALSRSNVIKGYMNEYGFTVTELLNAREIN